MEKIYNLYETDEAATELRNTVLVARREAF
jgi:hypothetical protein